MSREHVPAPMQPVPGDAVADALGRLDDRELLRLVAATWEARGYATGVDAGVVVAERDGETERIAVAPAGRFDALLATLGPLGTVLERVGPGRVDPVDDAGRIAGADAVVTPAPSRVRRLLADRRDGRHGGNTAGRSGGNGTGRHAGRPVRVVGPTELRDLLLYGIERETGREIAADHLDLDLTVDAPSAPPAPRGRSGDGPPAGGAADGLVAGLRERAAGSPVDGRVTAAAVLLAVALVAAAALGASPAALDGGVVDEETGAAVGDGALGDGDDGSGAAAGGDRAGGGDRPGVWTAIPSAAEERAGGNDRRTAEPLSSGAISEYLPGLDTNGVSSADRLAQSHGAAVAGRSYALRIRSYGVTPLDARSLGEDGDPAAGGDDLLGDTAAPGTAYGSQWRDVAQLVTVVNGTHYRHRLVGAYEAPAERVDGDGRSNGSTAGGGEGKGERGEDEEGDLRLVRADAYADGVHVWRRIDGGTVAYSRRVATTTGGGEGVFADRAEGYVARYLSAGRTTVTRTDPGMQSRAGFVVTARGDPQRISGNVTDYRAVASVTPDGLVASLEVRYELTVDGETRVVEFGYDYRQLDAVSASELERPDWLREAITAVDDGVESGGTGDDPGGDPDGTSTDAAGRSGDNSTAGSAVTPWPADPAQRAGDGSADDRGDDSSGDGADVEPEEDDGDRDE